MSPPPHLIIQRHGSEMVVGGRQGGRPLPSFWPFSSPPRFLRQTREAWSSPGSGEGAHCVSALSDDVRALLYGRRGRRSRWPTKRGEEKMSLSSSQKAHHGRHRVAIRFFPSLSGAVFQIPAVPKVCRPFPLLFGCPSIPRKRGPLLHVKMVLETHEEAPYTVAFFASRKIWIKFSTSRLLAALCFSLQLPLFHSFISAKGL